MNSLKKFKIYIKTASGDARFIDKMPSLCEASMRAHISETLSFNLPKKPTSIERKDENTMISWYGMIGICEAGRKVTSGKVIDLFDRLGAKNKLAY